MFVDIAITAFTSSFGNFDLDMPEGAAEGQRALAFIGLTSGGLTITAPTGWEESPLQSGDVGSPGTTFKVFEKLVLSDSEDPIQEFHASGSDTGIGFIVVLSGRHATAPATFATPTASGDSSDTTSPRTLSLASGTADGGEDVVVVNLVPRGGGSDVWTQSNWGNSFVSRGSANITYLSGEAATRDNVPSGALGSISVDVTRTSGDNGAACSAIVVAIPAAESGGSGIAPLASYYRMLQRS